MLLYNHKKSINPAYSSMLNVMLLVIVLLGVSLHSALGGNVSNSKGKITVTPLGRLSRGKSRNFVHVFSFCKSR